MFMSTATVAHSRVSDTPGQERLRPNLPILILVYLIVWVFTRAHFMADTNVYTEAILDHGQVGAADDFRSLTSNPFWDFGHLWWRPFGWLCWLLFQPLTGPLTQHNQRAEALW